MSLVDDIHEAVLRPELWPVALAAIARAMNVKDIAIGAFDTETERHESLNLPIDPGFEHSYASYWAPRNFLWQGTCTLPIGQLFSFETVMAREEFVRTEFFNEWWKPQGMVRSLGTNLLVEGSLSVVATVYRPASRPDFDTADTAKLRGLVPHLQRAMQLRSRLGQAEQEHADLRVALAALDKPALLVDRNARVLFANPHAERLIADQALRVSRRGCLTADAAAEAAQVQRVVFDALEHGGAGGRIPLRRSSGRPVTLLVSPLHASVSTFARRAALILVDDPDQVALRPPEIATLRAAYGLTNAEAKLALALAAGLKLRETADLLGITFSTARAHLAHVFQKVDVTTQSQLVRVMIKGGLG